jgi:hypothetical protein
VTDRGCCRREVAGHYLGGPHGGCPPPAGTDDGGPDRSDCPGSPTAIEGAHCLREVALDALFMVIRFTDASRPTVRAAVSYVVTVPKYSRRQQIWRASVRRCARTANGGLVCCQAVRRRGGQQIMATYNESD